MIGTQKESNSFFLIWLIAIIVGEVLHYFSTYVAFIFVLTVSAFALALSLALGRRTETETGFRPYGVWIDPKLDVIAKDYKLSDHDITWNSEFKNLEKSRDERGYHVLFDGIDFDVLNSELIFHKQGNRGCRFSTELNRREIIEGIKLNKKPDLSHYMRESPQIYVKEKWGIITIGVTTPESSTNNIGITEEGDDQDEIELAKLLGITEIGTKPVEDVIKLLEKNGWKASLDHYTNKMISLDSKYFMGSINYL